MPGLVVVALVALHELQHRNAAGQEEAVGADDDQYHRHEEQAQGGDHALGGDGDVVAAPQGQQADDHQGPFDPGLFLAHFAAPEQLNGLGPAHLHQVGQQQEQEDGGEDDDGPGHALPVEGVGHGDVKGQQVAQHQEHQPVQQHPYDQPGADGQQRAENGLQSQHRGDVALLQAQNVVQAQLLFAPLDQKAVGVVEEDDAEQPHDDDAEVHDDLHGVAAGEGLVDADGGHDEEADHRQRRGEQEGQVEAAVVFDVAHRQSEIEVVSHARSPPVASMVRVSLIF